MSDEVTLPEGGGNVDISTDDISTEIGSGEVEAEVTNESGLAQEIDGESVDGLAEDVEEAIEAGASEEQIQEMIETFKIKVNGQERDVTLDWNNKEDIVRRLQMAEAGQSAMQRASEVERGFDHFLQDATDNPMQMLEQLGYDPVEFAESIIQKQITQLQKTPDQLAQEERDVELEDLRQRLKSQESERETAVMEQLNIQASNDLDNQITEALSSTTELPKSPYVVKRIADAMITAIRNGHEDVTANDVIPWVQGEINDELQQLFGAMPDQALNKYIGKQTIDRLRNQRLGKMNKPMSKVADTGRQMPEEKKELAKIKLNDWLKGKSSL